MSEWPIPERAKVGNCPWCTADLYHTHGQSQACRDRQVKAQGHISHERDHIFNDVGQCDRCKKPWTTTDPCK